MKFQDKFYDIIDHNKCPSSEKSSEKCILRNSYFHHSEPNYGQCLVPCKIKKYQVKNIGFKYGDHAKGIRIWFEREVEVTKSSLKTNELGFISKIGGDIGLCKNLLWLIIVLISASSVLMSRFNMLTR